MKVLRGFITILAVVVLALTMSGCSTIAVLFATPTPTRTNTPTPTSTPTNTPTPTSTRTPTPTLTPTPTPLPPVSVQGCLNDSECPGSRFITTYLPSGVSPEYNKEYPISITYDTMLRMSFSWCAIDQKTLDANMKDIKFIFAIDGQSYVDSFKQDHTTDSSNNPCVAVGGVLTGWKIGQSHRLSIGIMRTANLNDGWNDYPAGTDVTAYMVQPIDIPTATPTPTATFTPTNTFIPPTDVPYVAPTAVPACNNMGSLYISNTTGGVVSLYLTGTAYYYFDLHTGDNTLSVCSGDYSYTAYGCGGASDTGSMTTGESHEFYCQ